MIVNSTELERILVALKKNPEKANELLKDFMLFSATYEKDDGIPPRFGANFRNEGPKWEKVSGIDFEIIGRILVCHLCIEHYIDNLIYLSTPENFEWNESRMSFSQKLKLIRKMKFIEATKFYKGIEILNSIRNDLSHNMLAKIDEVKFKKLESILLKYLCNNKSKEEQDEIISHMSLYSSVAIIERFTSLTCANIAGYCTSIINKEGDGETFYSYIRSS
jgi:hypothetical protein